MSRIIAIDYGKKRTGIAVTDILQIIANGLTTVPTTELMDFLLNYVAKEPVERIIVPLFPSGPLYSPPGAAILHPGP